MIRLTGISVRPKGSNPGGPKAGTAIEWRLAQPIADLAHQAEALRWPILGIVGNTAHLQKSGDHTPWSNGKVRGVVYAIDVHPPNDFEAYYVARATSDYDTTWIDFININGHQYSNAGKRVGTSGDQHLHVSVAQGFEDTHVTLFSDYGNGDDMPSAKEVGTAVWADEVSSPELDKGKPHKAHEGVINSILAVRKLEELEKKLTVMATQLDTLSKGGQVPAAPINTTAVANEILSKLVTAITPKR